MVRRGEIVLDFDALHNWNNELNKMNDGKEVHHTDIQILSFVQLLGYMRLYFHLPYRQTEGGVVIAHAGEKAPSYSRLQYN